MNCVLTNFASWLWSSSWSCLAHRHAHSHSHTHTHTHICLFINRRMWECWKIREQTQCDWISSEELIIFLCISINECVCVCVCLWLCVCMCGIVRTGCFCMLMEKVARPPLFSDFGCRLHYKFGPFPIDITINYTAHCCSTEITSVSPLSGPPSPSSLLPSRAVQHEQLAW